MSASAEPSAELSERARQGDPEAQFELGGLVRKGASGSPSNLPAAMQWYFKAASQNHVGAQLALGNLLLDDLSSIGVKRNPSQAVRWLEKAAQTGEVSAQYRLAMLLLKGDGVERNAEEGMRWLLLATEAGHSDARFEASCRYALGTDVATDSARSLQLLIAGVEQEHVPSLNHIAMLIQNGAWLDRDETLAARIYQYAFFKLNSLDAADSLGIAYSKGIGFVADHDQALQLFEYAVYAGRNESMYSVGLLRLSAPAVKDLVEAVKWGALSVQYCPEGNGQKLLGVLGGLCTAQQLEEGRARAANWKRVPRGMTVLTQGELVNPLAGRKFTIERNE